MTDNLRSRKGWNLKKSMHELPMEHIHLETITIDKVLSDIGGFQGIILVFLLPLFNYLLLRNLRVERLEQLKDRF